LKGRCDVYTGEACQEFFENSYFYIESFEDQVEKEGNIKTGLDGLGNVTAVFSFLNTWFI